jgi:predicted RNase H-like HicB family nuclease
MNTQQEKHYLDILASHEKQWIALSPDRTQVFAAGKSLQEVNERIKDKTDAIVTYVLPQDGFYAPLCLY